MVQRLIPLVIRLADAGADSDISGIVRILGHVEIFV